MSAPIPFNHLSIGKAYTMGKSRHESIEDIAAELRLGFTGGNVAAYFKELANRIEAAHNEGVLQAVEDLMHGKSPIG